MVKINNSILRSIVCISLCLFSKVAVSNEIAGGEQDEQQQEQQEHRDLARFPMILSYEPASQVSHYAMIDQDVKVIARALSKAGNDGLTTAEIVYANSSNAILTLKAMSTVAEEKMGKCDNGSCPYEDYDKFYKYYGKYDYADEFLTAAFNKGITEFDRGGYGFSTLEAPGLKEFVAKSVVVLHLWMYVISEMERAIDVCKAINDQCSNHPSDEMCQNSNNNNVTRYVNDWDRAVALYVGSEQRQPTHEQNADLEAGGFLLYKTANHHCTQFATCGEQGGSVKGPAQVNEQIMSLFSRGKLALLSGNCAQARQLKEDIAQQMTIPLIQGTIFSAYEKHFHPATGRFQGIHHGLSAVYAASILPIVYSCNQEDALTIYNHLRPQNTNDGSSNPLLFTEVKRALEKNYDCMGVTCDEIGGILQRGGGAYRQDAEPCGVYDTPPVFEPTYTAAPEQSSQHSGGFTGSNTNNGGMNNARPNRPFRNGHHFRHNATRFQLISTLSAAIMVLLSGCCVLILCRTWKTGPMIKDGDEIYATGGVELNETQGLNHGGGGGGYHDNNSGGMSNGTSNGVSNGMSNGTSNDASSNPFDDDNNEKSNNGATSYNPSTNNNPFDDDDASPFTIT